MVHERCAKSTGRIRDLIMAEVDRCDNVDDLQCPDALRATVLNTLGRRIKDLVKHMTPIIVRTGKHPAEWGFDDAEAT